MKMKNIYWKKKSNLLNIRNPFPLIVFIKKLMEMIGKGRKI